jgi:DNA topoisomerase-1
MPKYLVVVESPAKAKTINKFLGSNYIVKASYGHVRDLPKSDLGVDVDNDFAPKYVQPKESSKAIKEIKAAAEKVDQILLASDPDREGEAIGWHVAEILKAGNKPVARIVFNEITKKSVVEATKNPRPIDENLVNAQQARRILDRLVGYKISPLLQWGVQKGLSAGRVQSVAVRMVVEREEEIRAFVPIEYWTLDATFVTQKNETFVGHLNRIKGEKAELPNEGVIKSILADLEGASYKVANVERKEVKRRPYPPFITSSLQQEASRKLRYSPRRTMALAQQLYEGIALGDEGTVGLITYMRTDSTRLAGEALADVRSYISQNFKPELLPEQPNFYASKKGAQDAHEAIRATSAFRTPQSVKQYLDADQLALYTLIWQRFVACQMAPCVLDQMAIDVAAKQYEFRATGSLVKFAGFTELYEETTEEQPANGDGEAQQFALPNVQVDEPVKQDGLKPEQHFTKPPPRFSEASLIRALEENGIGRPSTYAPTINTIVEREYVEKEKGRLKPTPLGEKVNKVLLQDFPDIFDIGFTARLEDDLDHVEDGQREWHDLLRAFYVDFKKDLNNAENRILESLGGKDQNCPACGSPMEVRQSWFGIFAACKRYPECKTVLRAKKAEAEKTDKICEKCGSPMVIRSGRFGKFLACSAYPKCKNAKNLDKDGNIVDRPPKEEAKKTDELCPKCKKNTLVIRKSRTGEEFYGCGGYPKCKFTRPMELGLKCTRPGCSGTLVSKMGRGRRFIGCDQQGCDIAVFGKLDQKHACQKCGNPWTTIVKAKGKAPVRRCPVPTCAYEEELPEAEE